jgi:hypothetical protein
MARTFESNNETSPRPPALRPTWTTWMWLAFAVAVIVLTIFGLFYAGRPY